MVLSETFDRANGNWPDLSFIKKLQSKHFMQDGSPQWWSVDHTSDPRLYMPFAEFQSSLVHLGLLETTRPGFERYQTTTRDVYLYPNPKVPVTILDLDIEGQQVPFLLTARPYHESELDSNPFPLMIHDYPTIEALDAFRKAGGTVSLHDHFYPHVRGIVAGQRGDHYFWYPLFEQARKPISDALKQQGLQFIDIYIDGLGWGSRERGASWRAIQETFYLARHKLKSVPNTKLPVTFVCAEELMTHYGKEDLYLITRYPFALEGCAELLTVYVSNRIYHDDHVHRPCVLGFYAHNGNTGYTTQAGIARVRDFFFAKMISQQMSDEWDAPVDALLFTPNPGRALYEVISSDSGF